jgi:hypothetical protein
MRPNLCKSAVLLSCLSALFASSLEARQDDDPLPDAGNATFLLVAVGGKAAALGQTGMADGGSTESVFWNPAGLASLTQSEIGIHHARTFASDNTALTAAFITPGDGVMALTAYLVDFGSQDVVTFPGPGGPVTGRISPKNLEVLASYAMNVFGPLSLGANYKMIQFRQDCSGDCGAFPTAVGTTHGFDLGAQLIPGDDPSFRFGAAVQHAGFNLRLEDRAQESPLPTRWQVGGMYQIRLPAPTPETEGIDARILLDAENAWGRWSGFDLNVGLELGYGDLIRLRTGYASVNTLFRDDVSDTGARGPSVGMGIRLGRLAVDFSQVFFDDANFDEPVYIGIRADF